MLRKGAAILLGLTALVLLALGLDRIVYWASLPLEPRMGAGEWLGIFVGVVIVLFGAGVAATARGVWRDRTWAWIAAGQIGSVIVLLSYIAWQTPGPPPLPIALTIAAGVVGVALVGLVIARALGPGRGPT